MFSFPIGVMIDSFRTDTHTAIKQAAALGADGIQMYCTKGVNTPENLTPRKRRELLDVVRSHGLRFSALCGDLGQGFGDAAQNPALIEKSKRILDLAVDLDTNIVTTHIGVVPEDTACERYLVMQEACAELAHYAHSIGAHFAVETGPERAVVLKAFLDSLSSRGVAVNLDPANLVMVTGDDPVAAVYHLRDYIVHTHAKDGVMLNNIGAEYVYRVKPRPQELQGVMAYKETPLGEGSVDFKAYLAALDEIGYRGFLTIEREVGESPAADIGRAREFLLEMMA